MNYLQAVAYIESLAPTILNPDLRRFRLFMDEHEHLQDAVPAIHVAGTNGKGSTVAIIDSVLRASGLRTGRFTGPHLLRWNERFQVDGAAIDDDAFAEYATRLRDMSEDFGRRHPELGALTWFEFITAIAFFYFFDRDVDVAVFEVGLGGRWDATNVLSRPLVCAITTIGLDHTHILGETIAEIAREKAGIIKGGVPVVTGATDEALVEITAKAKQSQAPLVVCETPDTVRGGIEVDTSAFLEAISRLSLPGNYQRLNALIAATAAAIADRSLQRDILSHLGAGFANVYWPGRFQYLRAQNVLLDGAHNVAGITALSEALDAEFGSERRRLLVLSFFQTKNVAGAVKQLVRPGDIVFAAEAQTARAVTPAQTIVDLCTACGATASPFATIAQAFDAAQKARIANDDLIVVTGSFATVKETMLAIGWNSVEDGRRQTQPTPSDPGN